MDPGAIVHRCGTHPSPGYRPRSQVTGEDPQALDFFRLPTRGLVRWPSCMPTDTRRRDGRPDAATGPAPRVQRGASVAHVLGHGSLVFSTEVQPLLHLSKSAVQDELDIEHPICEMVTSLLSYTSQSRGPDDSVLVVMTSLVEHAPKPVRRPRCVEGRSGAECANHAARTVHHCRPRMRQHCVWIVVERLDATQQQVTPIKIVVSSTLVQLSPGLPYKEDVVRDEADIALLTDISDTTILPGVAKADFRRAVRRCVVRHDQLEILVGLSE